MSRPFDQLTCADLRSLASAASSGRLSRPYSTVSLGRLLDPSIARATAEELESLALDPIALGVALLLLAVEREAAEVHAGRIELVWTGPEMPGSRSRDTAVVVPELFAAAETTVLVAGFAVYQGKEVFSTLARRMVACPSLRVKLFLNIARPQASRAPENEIVRDFVEQFRQKHWPSPTLPDIYYDPRALLDDHAARAVLHAKCIIVDDRRLFVTSANLTTAAQERNIEAGLLVEDRALARSLRMQFEALVETGTLKPACRTESA